MPSWGIDVVLAAANGQDARETATGLLLTVPTVEHNLESPLAKLGMDSPADLPAGGRRSRHDPVGRASSGWL